MDPITTIPLCTSAQLDCVNKINVNDFNTKCLPPCSGLMLTSFSKSEPRSNIEHFIPKQVAAYKSYTKWNKFPSELKGWFEYFAYNIQYLFGSIWMEKQAEICKDLLWHPNIRQNHQGQSSKICRHAVSNWRHHGTSHWFLHYQWSGNSVFCNKNYCEYHEKQNSSCLK